MQDQCDLQTDHWCAPVKCWRSGCSSDRPGYWYVPKEVEDIIKLIDGVTDCLAFGTPDERLGQQVTTIAEPRDGATPTSEHIIGATKQRIAGYKSPRRVILPSVPRFPNGKPDFETARAIASGRQR
jgi:fatty-acyl-CoA synthase